MESPLGDRIIVLVDMDCFYVQVEQKLCPQYYNTPCIVTQYNSYNGGGIIAVNYEARACGVKRGGMRGDQAVKLCPNLHNFKVPESRGKADLTRYREAGAEVIEVLCEFSDCVERASVDEAFIDLTAVVEKRLNDYQNLVSPEKISNTFVVGWNRDSQDDDLSGWLGHISEEEEDLFVDRKLALAASIVEEMRAAVYNKTKYRCSAGIAHNKVLAKLACGIHKPNKQTVLPHASVLILYNTLSLKKVRTLGGKFGDEVMEKLGIETMGELAQFAESQLVSHFGRKNGLWLYNMAKGIEHDPVNARQLSKSIGCGKNFPGKQCLDSKKKILHWLEQLGAELAERLIRDQSCNKRVARSLVVSVGIKDEKQTSLSRTCALHSYNSQRIANDAIQAIHKLNTAPSSSLLWQPPIVSLSLAASKFEDSLESVCNIQSYLVSSKDSTINSSIQTSSTKTVTVNSDAISNPQKPPTSKKLPASNINNFFTKIKDVYQVSENKSSESENLFNNGDVIATAVSIKCDTEKSPTSKNPTSGIDHFFSKIKDVHQVSENKSSECENLFNNSDVIATTESIKCDTEKPSTSTKIPTSGIDHVFNKIKDKCQVEDSESSQSEEQLNHSDIVLTHSKADVDEDPLPSAKGFFARKLKEREATLKSLEATNSALEETEDTNIIQASTLSQQNTKDNEHSLSSDQSGKVNFFKLKDSKHSGNNNSEISIDLSPDISVICPKCDKLIPCWEEQEHADYHMALDIQREMRVAPSVNIVKSTITKSKTGTKRTNNSHKSKSAQKKRKQQVTTLDNFFK